MARDREPRCGGCGQTAPRTRRGLCAGCYARWVRARPVGLGASCASCTDRRLEHLRHFELRGLWVVLCHHCCARAERLTPAPRSLEVLLSGIRRQGREGISRRAVRPLDGAALERRREAARRAEDLVAAGVAVAAARAVPAMAVPESEPFELTIELAGEFTGDERRDPLDEPITVVRSLESLPA